MSVQDEKTPASAGAWADMAQVRGRHQVVGRLLAAREELQHAMHLARQRGYPAAGQVIEDHLAREVDGLFAQVLPLLEQTEDPQAYEARLRSVRVGAGSGGATQP